MASGTKDMRGTGITPGPGTSPTISVLVPLVTDTSTGNPVRFTITVVDRIVQIFPASPAVTSHATAELPPEGNDTLYVCKETCHVVQQGHRHGGGQGRHHEQAPYEQPPGATTRRSLTHLTAQLVDGQVCQGRHSHIHPHQQSTEHCRGLCGGPHFVPVPK